MIYRYPKLIHYLVWTILTSALVLFWTGIFFLLTDEAELAFTLGCLISAVLLILAEWTWKLSHGQD